MVGLGCGAAIGWTGVGAVACGALAGAAGSFVTGVMEGKSGWDLVGETVFGGLVGGLTGGAFSILGQALSAGVRGVVANGLRSGLGAAGKAFVGEAANIASGVGSAARGLANAVRPGAAPLREGASALVGSAGSRGAGGAARESIDAGSNNIGAGAKPSCHSFDPKTPVLLADGSTKQIKDIKLGDRVLATDPAAGTTTPKTVTALHINQDVDLTDVTVTAAAGSGAAGSSVSNSTGTATVLLTTQHHPFWDQTTHTWTNASDLTPGHHLLTADGTTVTITDVRNHTSTQQMRDLTVADTHTYYVIAGTTPVLVHNCDLVNSVNAEYTRITGPGGLSIRQRDPVLTGVQDRVTGGLST